MLFYLTATAFGKTIEAQVILFGIDFVEQPAFEVFVLHSIYATFKNRLLNALANALAHFCDTPKPSPALTGFGVDVVTDDDQHDYLPWLL